jgi:hypothetical protein
MEKLSSYALIRELLRRENMSLIVDISCYRSVLLQVIHIEISVVIVIEVHFRLSDWVNSIMLKILVVYDSTRICVRLDKSVLILMRNFPELYRLLINSLLVSYSDLF